MTLTIITSIAGLGVLLYGLYRFIKGMDEDQ